LWGGEISYCGPPISLDGGGEKEAQKCCGQNKREVDMGKKTTEEDKER